MVPFHSKQQQNELQLTKIVACFDFLPLKFWTLKAATFIHKVRCGVRLTKNPAKPEICNDDFFAKSGCVWCTNAESYYC